MVRVRVIVFHMSIPCDKTFLLVPSSRSSVKVKVKYQDHNFQKMAIVGAFVFHKHILFLLIIPCDKTFLLVPSSRSSVKVKVKYQDHNFRKMAVAGALVFHKHILFILIIPMQTQCFWRVYWNQPVSLSVRSVLIRLSICVQDTSFCQSAGGSIKSYLATALVSSAIGDNVVFLCYTSFKESQSN